MSEFLFQYYPVHPTTWVYLSSLLMIGVYFKFSRFWSVRNLDLALLILLAPGLLMVHFGEQRAWQEQTAGSDREVADGQGDAELAQSIESEPVGPSELDSGVPQPGVAIIAEPPVIDHGANTLADELVRIESDSDLDVAGTADEGVIEGSETTEPVASLSGHSIMFMGYIWLFIVLGIFLIRLLLDPTMVRRPLLDSKSVRKQLNARSMRFATREEVFDITGLQPGSIPPFGSVFDLKTYCDERLCEEQVINFNAGDHAISISLAFSEFERVERPSLGTFAAD